MIAFVVWSLYRYSKKWLSCKTALFPTLINLLIPKFLLFKNLTTPIVNPPLCEIMEILPCFGRYLVANEAFRLYYVFITPTQLGPNIVKLYLLLNSCN